MTVTGDPLMGLLCSRSDGKPLAGKSTLNRLETAKEHNTVGTMSSSILSAVRPIRAARPNRAHEVLAAWEARGLLKEVITQNVDSVN